VDDRFLNRSGTGIVAKKAGHSDRHDHIELAYREKRRFRRTSLFLLPQKFCYTQQPGWFWVSRPHKWRRLCCRSAKETPVVPFQVAAKIGCVGASVSMTAPESLKGVAAVPVAKRAISDPNVLNEAYHYGKPSSFSRGMRIDLDGLVILLISGTASIDEHGASIHVGDFRSQCRRTFQNITALLASEGATWRDVVRTSCFLRDIERDYAEFNQERTAFFTAQGLDPLPASTGIEAKLCRPELLIEIEAIAMFRQVPKASYKAPDDPKL